MVKRFPRARRAARALLGAGLLLGGMACTAPRVHWSQRVRLNGRDFVFKRLDSLKGGPEGHRIEFQNGDFLVEGKGAIAVNGFEIRVQGSEVHLANQRIELSEGQEVRFAADMSWQTSASTRRGP
ncbi:MAG: hypothetical protein ACRD2T_05730 [Thermoanaerobaculia bacterium]